MEKISSLDRFIDKKTTKEDARILLTDISTELTLQGKEPLDYEKEKSFEQIQICNLLNNSTNEILNKYGIDNFDIPPDNIHVFDSRLNVEGIEIGGQFRAEKQLILVRDSSNRLCFAHYLSHEMIHFKSHGAVQIPLGNNEDFNLDYDYRSGFKMKSRDGSKAFFHRIDEALTEELSKEIIENIKKNPNFIFDEDVETTKEISSEFFSQENPEDIVYAEKLDDSDPRKGKYLFLAEPYGYEEERRILQKLITKISKKTNSSCEEILSLFMIGKLRGNILPIAKLIDLHFGFGTFRKIGEVSNLADIKEFNDFVEKL